MKNNLQPAPAFVRPNISGNVNSRTTDEFRATSTSPDVQYDRQDSVVLYVKEEVAFRGYLVSGLSGLLILLVIFLVLSIYRRSRHLK